MRFQLSDTAARIISVVCIILLIVSLYFVITVGIPNATMTVLRPLTQSLSAVPVASDGVVNLPTPQTQLTPGTGALPALPTANPAVITPIPTIVPQVTPLNPQDQQLFDQANNSTVGADSFRFSVAFSVAMQQGATRDQVQYSLTGIVTGMSDLSTFAMQVEDSSLPFPVNNEFVEVIAQLAFSNANLYMWMDVPQRNLRVLPFRLDLNTMICSVFLGQSAPNPGQSCISDAMRNSMGTVNLSGVYDAFAFGRFITTTRGAEQDGRIPYTSTVNLPALLSSPEFANLLGGFTGGAVTPDPTVIADIATQLPMLEATLTALQATDPDTAALMDQQLEQFRALARGETPADLGLGAITIDPAALPPMSLTLQHWVDRANPRVSEVNINFNLQVDDPDNPGTPLLIALNVVLTMDGFNQTYTVTPPTNAVLVTDLNQLPPNLIVPLN